MFFLINNFIIYYLLEDKKSFSLILNDEKATFFTIKRNNKITSTQKKNIFDYHNINTAILFKINSFPTKIEWDDFT